MGLSGRLHAFEELVAELGSAFLCAHLEVTNTPRPDHAQYCASWVEVLQGDTKAIFSAASLATRAVDYLFGLQPAASPEPGQSTKAPHVDTSPRVQDQPARPEPPAERQATSERGGPRQ